MLASRLSRLAVFALAAVLAWPALAFDPNSPSPVNLEPGGIGLRGYDPVAYFLAGAPTEGSADVAATHAGAIYRFSSEENRATFLAEPDRYLPAYGGFCALAMSFGQKVDIDPMAWKIVDDVLYVQANPRAAKVWDGDIPGNIAKANGFWPEVKDIAPAEIR
jgi:hypothetical protein